MSQFKILKRLELKSLGEGWENCYLEFSAITFSEAKVLAGLEVNADDPKSAVAMSDKAMKLLEDHYISGKALGLDGKEIEVKKNDLKDFPIEVVNEAITLLSRGEASPKV